MVGEENIIKHILHFLMKVWAYFPILALTDDSNFLAPNFTCGELAIHEYYLSLINICFGERIIQFVSFPIKQSEKKIVWFRVKVLSLLNNFELSEEKINELHENYNKHYDLLTHEERTIEKEALLQHLDDEQARIDTSFNKMNAFTAVILAIIPIAVMFVDREKLLALSIFGKVIFVIMIYAYVNLCAWIIQAIRVRTFSKSSFRDLKESDDKAKMRNWQIYYDWQQAQKSADLFVSFVSYTKNWIIVVIVFTIVFSLSIGESNKNKITNNNSTDQVYTVEVNCIEKPYNYSVEIWHSMIAKLHTGRYKRVLILYKSTTDLTGITEGLKPFTQQDIIFLDDSELRDNEVKIILEE